MLDTANEGDMRIEDYLISIGYKIESGSQYLWSCYGSEAWLLESKTTSAVVNCPAGSVYEICLHDDARGIYHRWIHPEYLEGYLNEATDRGCDPWQAYDDVGYVQIEDGYEILKLIDGSA
jgi:hypothetical protein